MEEALDDALEEALKSEEMQACTHCLLASCWVQDIARRRHACLQSLAAGFAGC